MEAIYVAPMSSLQSTKRQSKSSIISRSLTKKDMLGSMKRYRMISKPSRHSSRDVMTLMSMTAATLMCCAASEKRNASQEEREPIDTKLD